MNTDQKNLAWINTSPLETLGITTWLFTTHELRKAGWKVTLILSDDSGSHEKLGVEYMGIPMPNIYLLRQLIFHLRVLSYISRLTQPPDVIMFHEMSIPFFIPFRVLRILSGKKLPLYVLDIRSLPMQPSDISGIKDRIRNLYFNTFNWLANDWAVDGRVAITRPMAQVLRIPQDKLWGVWTSGVQPEMFQTTSNLRNWKDIGQEVRLIYIGSMSDGRNLAVFGQAVIAANQKGMNFSMTFIGEGTEMDDLLLLQKQEPGCIHVFPAVPHDQVQNWLAQAHIGVLPFPDEIKFRVSSPIKLFEYTASGLVILATRIECHTSVIGEGNYVFWAEKSTVESFVDCLHQVWQKRDALPIMGEQAETVTKNWTWAKSAANLSEALLQGIRKYG